MKTIKHLNIEYDSNNLFSLESKVFKLTKGNAELLVSLYNDIVNDFYDKIEKILNQNKIDFTRNDVDHELFNTIRIDSFSNFCNTNKIEYVPNDTYTNEEFEINIMLGASVIFDFIYFHFDNNKKLRKEYHTIRYDREYETEEMKEIREYFEDVISFLSYKIELEYDIIKKEDIEDQPEPEPLKLPDTTENANKTINKVKSPQDKIESYLYNEINIELYDDFSFVYKEDKELLHFFNNLFVEFDFFLTNKDNYLEIVNHFFYDELGYLFWNGEIYFNPKTESNKLFELFNLYECLTRLIKYNYPLNNRTGALIKTCEHIEKLYQKIHKLYLPDNKISEVIKTETKDTEPDASTVKKNKPKKALNEFIHNIKDKGKFLQELKSTFPTERGKSIKIIISLLTRANLLIINSREFKDFHSELEAFFDRNIGSRQSINDVKFSDIHKSTIEPIEKKLNPLIKNHITN